MTGEELRAWVAEHVIGDDPPPVTSEARDMIRRTIAHAMDGDRVRDETSGPGVAA
jgi:hypothetical protein